MYKTMGFIVTFSIHKYGCTSCLFLSPTPHPCCPFGSSLPPSSQSYSCFLLQVSHYPTSVSPEILFSRNPLSGFTACFSPGETKLCFPLKRSICFQTKSNSWKWALGWQVVFRACSSEVSVVLINPTLAHGCPLTSQARKYPAEPPDYRKASASVERQKPQDETDTCECSHTVHACPIDMVCRTLTSRKRGPPGKADEPSPLALGNIVYYNIPSSDQTMSSVSPSSSGLHVAL